ncbi:type II CRISPR-associated endonuclease Cas1 [Campylobacter molothri]|uniref:type II CRISPR-associated endonuclease Cas1 n=1 Tax=Campylobacter molothri TaxID=1032242 RepID=UPI001905F725|nr:MULTISPECIES: type II CRISPR-associated endonuclease Cas1 [unclassified Campylobacter]MBZ7928157.1 type II CRISPR-associated endonuclease Cas1 [Campylobacter sp. RM10542]MBZ7930907.1 type II CRISPR-associated endonuclease Cas1 [Campylobacter sp. RM12910]MBZ7934370.1 type II CRISPR-associated endonuclease Cas1 [Campylobacter sp. W0065]MBZ7955004.1 type II CRISPR-associated endonuclease Cas1 [Campylobacter sp. RM17709]MBK2000502.1 type II CRISPR-associated endonuclease Cas1 [Campylobacter sp.
MAYDEAFKSILITTQAKLSLEYNHLVIKQKEKEAKFFLKDINFIILESLQASLSSSLLNALAENKIILLTCDEMHNINGIFSPFLGHFISAKVAREQVAVSSQRKAILWQKIIKNKISNQAYVLKLFNHMQEYKELINLCKKVSLNDAKNVESTAASLYFKTLFGKNFYRNEICFVNSALNYGYAIIRSNIIRAVCISGLLPWQGIKHNNIYNSFNLCDDLIEVFRPLVDICVFNLKDTKESEFLDKESKQKLIQILQEELILENKSYPLNRAINFYVQNFKNALLENQELFWVNLK